MFRNGVGRWIPLVGLGVFWLVASALTPAARADVVIDAQSFCSDLDRVARLAPSGFRSILVDGDEAHYV